VKIPSSGDAAFISPCLLQTTRACCCRAVTVVQQVFGDGEQLLTVHGPLKNANKWTVLESSSHFDRAYLYSRMQRDAKRQETSDLTRFSLHVHLHICT
jgi:hypothetical protein